MLKWWSEIGLGTGSLVHSDPTAEKERSKAALRGRRRTEVNAEAPAENSLSVVGLLEIGQGLETGAERDIEDLINSPPYEKSDKEGESSKGGRDEKGKDNYNGEASVPPSPMQTICPSALARLETFVPMGFNVDHDLRDFLKRKSECVDSTVERDLLSLFHLV